MGGLNKSLSKKSSQTALAAPILIPAVALVSAAGIGFEIALTRIFSLYYQYHFAFLAVSLAVLGLSLGAAWERFTPPDANDANHARHDTARLLLAVSAALLIAAVGIALIPVVTTVLFHAVLALLPFVMIGRFMAFAFGRYSAQSGRLYAADLTGAAVGVVAALALLSLFSAFSLTYLLALLIGLTGVFLTFAAPEVRADQRTALAAAVVGVIGAAVFVINLSAGTFDYDPARLPADLLRDKTMLFILNNPEQQGKIVDTWWSPFARVDVVETTDTTAKYLFTDGGAGSYMLRYDGTPRSVAYLEGTAEYLPFTAVPTARTLIMGAGGGKDVIMALQAGAQHVSAVEVNPAMVAAARADASYNGGVYDLPAVETIIGDARTYAERAAEPYDLIYLNLVYTQAADISGQALVENYIFTREAFRTYLEKLKPGGHLAILAHNALEGSRAAITALAALGDLGITPDKALDHLLLWMMPTDDATVSTSLLLVGKDPLSADTLRTIRDGARALGMQSLYHPVEYETLFSPLRRGGTLDQYIQADADYDLSPTSDDRPYFFKLDPGLPAPIATALIAAVALVFGLSYLAFTLPARTGRQGWLARALYAALIGAGFMLIEIPLIQRLQLLLGQPILAIAVVLGGLLLSGGLGSLISQRWPEQSLAARVRIAAAWIVGVAALYLIALRPLNESLLGADLAVRVIAAFLLTALLGVAMGIPFPALLRRSGEAREQVALIWALNGAFSALGSVLAVVLSMTVGFGWALAAGIALYLALIGVAGRGLSAA